MAREYIVMRLGKGKKKIELCLERRIRKYGYAGLIISNLFQEDIVILVDDSRLYEYCIRRGYISAREDGTHPPNYYRHGFFQWNQARRDC